MFCADVQQQWEEGHITMPWLSQKDLSGKEFIPASEPLQESKSLAAGWLLLYAAHRRTDMPCVLASGFAAWLLLVHSLAAGHP